MFESLSDRLGAVLKRITGRGVLRPEDVDAALREVRMALLEADVNYKVVKAFGERVREQLVGAQVAESLTPACATRTGRPRSSCWPGSRAPARRPRR